MELQALNDEIKVSFAILIAEKVFLEIKHTDEKYSEGREALNKCWMWVECNGISGDDLYELIDNAECIGISEFAEKEKNLNIARLWSLLVDTIAYTSWMAYKKEKTKYLPQMLEGIKEDSILILIESAIETSFITQEEVQVMIKRLLSCYQTGCDNIAIKKEDLIKKVMNNLI